MDFGLESLKARVNVHFLTTRLENFVGVLEQH